MSELFYGLALLACPVGMGAMMWMMMRGRKSPPQPHADSGADSGAELTRMRAEIEQLRAGQRDTGRHDTGRHDTGRHDTRQPQTNVTHE